MIAKPIKNRVWMITGDLLYWLKTNLALFFKNEMFKIKHFFQKKQRVYLVIAALCLFFLICLSLALFRQKNQKLEGLKLQKTDLEQQLSQISQELKTMKNEDQYLRNEVLQKEINNIQNTYQQGVKVYENLLSLKERTEKTQSQDEQFSKALKLLAERNYASAAAKFSDLNQEINTKKETLAAEFKIPENIPEENTPPNSGYRRQKVTTDLGTFMVDLVAADLNSTRVIVETASESDCFNDCPTLPLATYVSRNGAFAGINGSYFCPAEYPSCADKKNSFDTLLMNKNKVYFNSENNVYSTVPAAIFYGNTAHFVAQSLEWGRDTGVDAVIANRPLLALNGELRFTGGGEPKEGAKGGRSFIGNTGSTVYIGVVRNATVAESARVVHTLGIQNALNLDNGGSTALWSANYKVGPGRNLASAVLLVRK